MHRRDFLRVCTASCTLRLGLGRPARTRAAEPVPLDVCLEPQLFLDDSLIERLDVLTRQVQQPRKLDKPVLDSKTFGTTQPYLSVGQDAQTKRFRIWYNRGPA